MNYQLTLICIIFLTFSGCGYEDIPVLAPPEKDSTLSDFFQFKMTLENVDDPVANSRFLGFEIFYRFFSPSDPTLSSNQQYTTKDQLVSNKFLRATYYKSDTARDTISLQDLPLVKIQFLKKGTPSTFKVTFAPLGNLPLPEEPYIYTVTEPDPDVIDPDHTIFDASINRQKLTIRRGVEDLPDNQGFYKPFTRASKTDADLKDFVTTSGTTPVTIVLYAVSYGKYQLSTTIYSTTVCLLSITRSLNVEE